MIILANSTARGYDQLGLLAWKFRMSLCLSVYV